MLQVHQLFEDQEVQEEASHLQVVDGKEVGIEPVDDFFRPGYPPDDWMELIPAAEPVGRQWGSMMPLWEAYWSG